jgi:outer membrane protein TolC
MLMDGKLPPTSVRPARRRASPPIAASLCALLATFALAGCAAYTPAPIQPAAFPAAHAARTLGAAPSGGAWAAAELLDVALARNPQVAAALERRRAALAALRGVRHPPAPSLSLTAEYANDHPHWGYGAAGDFPMRLGALRGAQITTAELQALQALYDHAQAVWDVRAAVARALTDLTSAGDEVAAADRLETLRGDRLTRIERRIALGEDDRLMGLGAQADLAAAAARSREARARQTQARLALAAALGVSPSAINDIRLAPAPTPPRERGDLPALRRDAITQRADVLRAIADYELAEAALRGEMARQYPEIRLAPGYMYDHGVSKLPFDLGLALPAWDGNRSGIAGAEAARAAAGRALEATQADVLAHVDAAAAALAAAETAAAKMAHDDVGAAQALADRTARAVQAGAADRVDDLGAQAVLAEAQLSLTAARGAVRRAGVDLEDALRRPFDPAEAASLTRVLYAAGAVR